MSEYVIYEGGTCDWAAYQEEVWDSESRMQLGVR